MFRYKSNKSALIVAVMAILLCFASITGATFALFTSNVDDGRIGVNTTSGNLKVDIINTATPADSLVGETLALVTTSTNREIIFEPGATYHTEGFRVKNKGNIPFNFICYISSDDTVSEDFFDAFDVWITTNPKSLDGAERLSEFRGRLEVEQTTDVYYLVFQMKPTADNGFSDRYFTGVGITVCAIQGNANFD